MERPHKEAQESEWPQDETKLMAQAEARLKRPNGWLALKRPASWGKNLMVVHGKRGNKEKQWPE
jgi:hypothetical protein